MAKQSKKLTQRAGGELSNHEIVTVAVFLLGGERRTIDTEDIAMKANDIAPGRFAWRKYPKQINIENVRTFLSDAKKAKNGSYLIGSGKEGWLLTESGLSFTRQCISSISSESLARDRLTPKERQWIRNERARMLNSEAFLKFIENGIDCVTLQEAEAFFRLDDYVTGKARESKLLRILNTFQDDRELRQATKKLAEKVRRR